MNILGFTIIQTATYVAQRKQFERLAAAYESEKRSYEAYIKTLLNGEITLEKQQYKPIP